MTLLIFRHGPAGDKAEWAETGKPDSERPLTPDGEKKTKKAAKGLARIAPKPDVLATSPLIRAVQTADALDRAYGKLKRVVTPSLSPDADPEKALAALSKLGKTVAVVGHEPQLSQLIAAATGAGTDFRVDLKKAGACLIEDGRLAWLLAPSQLRALA